MALRVPAPDLDPGDQFQSYARSASTALVVAALIALLLGLALGGLNVWEQYDQVQDFNGDQSFRYYVTIFLTSLAWYGLIAAVLFAGGLLVSSLAWFHFALSADFDDLYDAAEPGNGNSGGDDNDPPPARPSDWTRPIGS